MSPSYSAKIALKRDLKIRRRRVSTTAAVSWREWEEIAVVWRENCHQTYQIGQRISSDNHRPICVT